MEEKLAKIEKVLEARTDCNENLLELTSFLQNSMEGREGGIPLSRSKDFMQEFEDRKCRIRDCLEPPQPEEKISVTPIGNNGQTEVGTFVSENPDGTSNVGLYTRKAEDPLTLED